eukprot:scaffold160259_cov30-Tisochrysis_lutea.AAC.1
MATQQRNRARCHRTSRRAWQPRGPGTIGSARRTAALPARSARTGRPLPSWALLAAPRRRRRQTPPPADEVERGKRRKRLRPGGNGREHEKDTTFIFNIQYSIRSTPTLLMCAGREGECEDNVINKNKYTNTTECDVVANLTSKVDTIFEPQIPRHAMS